MGILRIPQNDLEKLPKIPRIGHLLFLCFQALKEKDNLRQESNDGKAFYHVEHIFSIAIAQNIPQVQYI